ncbi:MAG: ATP-binding protein [Thermoleophilia bacterium]|nr:ATP-binding protein [Thermoleophilia bacterium]
MTPACESYFRAIEVESETARLVDIRRFVEEVAAEVALDRERVFDLKVAVSEACANVVEHAGCETVPLRVRALIEAERLTFTVSDVGSFRPPNPCKQMAGNRGLGLPLMVALMDEVTFVRSPEGGTCVNLSVLLRAR